MGVLDWKKVELFYLVSLPSIKVHTEYEIAAHCSNVIKAPNGITCTAIVLCDKNGYVHVIMENDKKKKPISFKCNESKQPIKLCALTTNNILTIVAQDDTKFSLSIYIYDLNIMNKEGYLCISTSFLPATSSATSMQVAVIGPDKLFALGIGFEKGDILLHFSKINRDVSLNIRHHVVALGAIKGIQFDNCFYHQSEIKTCNVFVMSADGVYSLLLSDKGSVTSKFTLDKNKSMQNQYCTMYEKLSADSFFVVGRDDAIYCFSRDCRGPCYVINGQKEYLSWIDNYLVVVIKTLVGSLLIVVDVHSKLIVLHKRISNVLCLIRGDNNSYHIVTKGDSSKNIYSINMYKLQEHNTYNKVRLLIAKSMNNNAIKILENDASDECENVAKCRLQYGNDLLDKGNFSGAVTEYAQTVDVIKSYNIISKLLSLRNNVYLMQYINQLLKSKQARIEHKKLLDSCVDREKLNVRIQQFWKNRKDSTHHVCDFKHISQRLLTIANLVNESEALQAIEFHNSDEKEILNFFSEYGKEILLLYPERVLEIATVLVKANKVKDILGFVTILSSNTTVSTNLLADWIENSSSSNEKLSYYLLTLYLSLWRDKKISAQYVHDILKKISLSFEKILTITKLYLFDIRNENTNYIRNFESIKNKQIPVSLDQRSLINILHKTYISSKIYIFDEKPFLMETFTKYIKDAKSEDQSIKDLYKETNINNSLVSQFKSNPMEFRNRCCDICRQSLLLPSVYFLCQHSFHKDCLSSNYTTKNGENTECLLCTKNDASLIPYCNIFDSEAVRSNIINTISNHFASGMFHLKILNTYTIPDYRMSDKFGETLKKNYTNNPFDEDYDTSLKCE